MYRLYRLWRTTIRRCCLSTGTMDLLAWLLRTLSLPSATYQPTSLHTHLNWAGMARIWPHTSTCCLRPPGSLGLKHSIYPALLLCWVRSTPLHTYMYPTLLYLTLSLKIKLMFVKGIFVTPFCVFSWFIDTANIKTVSVCCRKSYSAWWGPCCLPLEFAGTRAPTSFSQGNVYLPAQSQTIDLCW